MKAIKRTSSIEYTFKEDNPSVFLPSFWIAFQMELDISSKMHRAIFVVVIIILAWDIFEYNPDCAGRRRVNLLNYWIGNSLSLSKNATQSTLCANGNLDLMLHINDKITWCREVHIYGRTTKWNCIHQDHKHQDTVERILCMYRLKYVCMYIMWIYHHQHDQHNDERSKIKGTTE